MGQPMGNPQYHPAHMQQQMMQAQQQMQGQMHGFGAVAMGGPPPEPSAPCPPGQQLPSGLGAQLHNPPTPSRPKRKDKARTQRAPLPSTVQAHSSPQTMSV